MTPVQIVRLMLPYTIERHDKTNELANAELLIANQPLNHRSAGLAEACRLYQR